MSWGRGSEKLTEVSVIVKKVTEKAVLVSDTEDETEEAIWLPKSLIEIERHGETSPYATITLPEWLAQEKGLI